MDHKVYCVISHTHWDREWYQPHELFRIRLTDMINNLLEILKAEPDYLFHLDAQTVVLEDYLEIFPQNKELLRKYIKEGRLIVGPWYVQNDFYLTSGESTIRNLMIGSTIAENFGKCAKVGYVADQFGIISQLPQLFTQAGIDTMIFGRGYNLMKRGENGEVYEEKGPCEFIWKAPDGSSVLAISMSFWYNNAQRFSENIPRALKYLRYIENSFEGLTATPYLLLMNGVDHLEAQENLLPILEKMRVESGCDIRQMSMQEYVNLVREKIDLNQLNVLDTELRYGNDFQILQGTLSSRVYIKHKNHRMQTMLEKQIEPLYTFIHDLGGTYPSEYLTFLWKSLIKNHAHDSICGCSVDPVHRHMEDRYERMFETGNELIRRGMDFIAAHISRDTLDDYMITVMNTSEINRPCVFRTELEFPVGEKVTDFCLLDESGAALPYLVESHSVVTRPMLSPINLPGMLDVDHYDVIVDAGEISALSYRSISVKTGTAAGELRPAVRKDYCLENEFIRANINPDGSIDLFDKQTKRCYSNIVTFEDGGDCGDSYVYRKPEHDRVLTTDGVIPKVSCNCANALETSYSLEYVFIIPKEYDVYRGCRTNETVEERVVLTLTLRRGARELECGVKIDNRAKDHRLRVRIHTGMKSDETMASIPFDMILRDKKELENGFQNGTRPSNGVILIQDETSGLAVYHKGLYEYENIYNVNGTIALTLLRATGWVTMPQDRAIPDKMWMAPENQCLREISVSFALSPFGKEESITEICRRGAAYANELMVYYSAVDLKKFNSGRAAVQDTEIDEKFFRPDPFANLKLDRAGKMAESLPAGLVLSAWKKAENNEDMNILRVYNLEETETELKLSKECYRLDLYEQVIEKLPEVIRIKSKEIMTVGIRN